MNHFSRINMLAAALAASVCAPAFAEPLVLTGKYIKVGISDAGTFGSNDNNTPAFIHDVNGTGTFDTNYDYIAPGTPHDGFSLVSDQFGFGGNDNNGAGGVFGSHSPTLLTGAAAKGYANAASWTGSNGFAEVTNAYFFNPGDQRVLVTTTIVALSDLTNLAFGRSVDPDSDAFAYGVYDTVNQRGNDLFGADDFVGSAGAVTGYTLALVNLDENGFQHTTQINSDCCGNVNPYDVLGHAGGDLGLSATGDYGLNLAYLIGSLSAGSSVTLSYAYAVGEHIDNTGDPTSAVPEPATWAMMVLGFGAVGFAMRRQARRTAAPVTA